MSRVYLHDHGAFDSGCGDRCGWYVAAKINQELTAEIKAALRSRWPLDPTHWPSDKDAAALVAAFEAAP